MSNLGMGVMIGMLGGNEKTVKTLKAALGKKIKTVAMIDNALVFRFEDGTAIKLFDDGQSCCEDRYMTTDDKLADFVGATLTGVRLQSADNRPAQYGDHEVQFLIVDTDKGSFTCETHNEHNGYYGGFLVVCRQAD